MRTNYLIVLIALCCCAFTFGQKRDDFKITDLEIKTNQFTKFLYSDTTDVKQQNPVKRFKDDIDATQKRYKNRNFEVLYGGKTLNLLFAKKLATNFNTSNDLTLQRSYFNINAAEKSFSIGYNLDNRCGDPLKQLNWVFSVGAKVIASNEFAAIATGSDFQENNIGLNLKYSYINNGRIGWKTANGKQMQPQIFNFAIKPLPQDSIIKRHKAFLYDKYDKKVAAFNKDEIPAIRKRDSIIYGEEAMDAAAVKGVKAKSAQLFYDMISEEIDFVESNGLYTTIFNSWWTIETYIPLGDKEYDITPINENNKARNVSLYPFNINVSYNFFKQKSNNFSYFGKFLGTLKGNSNIDVNGLTAKEFQSITTTNGEPTLTSPVSAIEVSKFDRFVTTSLKAEVAFFYKEWIGFSPSIEKNFGIYDGVNWKLGIPFSLKDKDGKPTVNFELQWRETKTLTSSQHLFGFSTSFFFGDLIK